MTRYYYYVVAGRQCDQTTQIFKVAVGTNKQSQRDYAFLLANAQQHGHYFEVVSRESDEFIRRLRLSLAEYDVQFQHRKHSGGNKKAARSRADNLRRAGGKFQIQEGI